MKKLYNKKGKVHPSPPLISDHLAFLPATILTLAAALSPQDREVLAYLISCSSSSTPTNTNTNTNTNNKKSFNGGGAEHPPLFYCSCFMCYTSYWVRWDASPNRQLIHDIIDAFEDELTRKNKMMKNHKKDKKNNRRGGHGHNKLNDSEPIGAVSTGSELVAVSHPVNGDDGEEGGDFEKGAVRKLVSFIGETIWGVWN